MLNAAAAFAFVWSAAFAADPVSYQAVVAAEAAQSARAVAEADVESAEIADDLADEAADWSVSWTMYHAGGGGATGNDSLGCRPVAMRTVATDPRVIPRRTRLFIRETVGLRMPDGAIHDGYWYATDTGGAVKGTKIDLYTGHGRASMQTARGLERRLTVVDAGRFDGCPPAWDAPRLQRASL